MKAPLFFIAAIVAFLALPFDFSVLASLLFAAGLAAFLIGDYRPTFRPVGAATAVALKPYERLRLAA